MYVGNLVYDKKEGYEEYMFGNVDIYKGIGQNINPGKGEYHFYDSGKKYLGYYVAGMIEGYGELINNDSTFKMGQWKNDQYISN